MRIAPSSSAAQVAYLTNAYPKISHSFIRREISSLEALGFFVLRVTVRPSSERLPDARDMAEKEKTLALLDARWVALALLGAVLKAGLSRPVAFARAIISAMRLGFGSTAGIGRHLAYLAEACRLSEMLRAQNIGHVHAHFGTNPSAVALLTSQLAGTTFSFTVHGPDEFDDPAGHNLPAKIRGAAFVVAISSFGRGQLMRWSDPSDWHKIRVVRCGIDAEFLDNLDPRKPAANRLVCVARLSAQKGLPLLVQAAAELKARGAEFELRIIGGGEMEAELREQVRALDLTGDVTFLGWRTAAEIREELLSARAFVLPSLAEGLPVVLMEALALQCPVITTAVAGISELVDHECGWLIPSGSVEHLGDAMLAALQAPDAQLEQMGAIGRERVRARHDASRNAAQLLEEFKALVPPSC
jgi:colanic acid/amylovoran biosynthesis glycosyltransferase